MHTVATVARYLDSGRGIVQPLELIVAVAIALLVVGRGSVGRLAATVRLSALAFRDGVAGSGPPRRCINCLGAIAPDAKFCPGCGMLASKVAIDV